MLPLFVHFEDKPQALLESAVFPQNDPSVQVVDSIDGLYQLGCILFQDMKKETVQRVEKVGFIELAVEQDFFFYLCRAEMNRLVHQVQHRIRQYASVHQRMTYQGVLHFYLKTEREWMLYELLSCYEAYVDQSATREMKQVQQLFDQRPETAVHLHIHAKSTREITCQHSDGTYVDFISRPFNEALSYIIHLRPQSLSLEDPHGLFSTHSLHLLKQLFQEKVIIHDQPPHAYPL